MTSHEFADWFNYHKSCYTTLESWLSKQGDGRRGAILARWAEALSSVPVEAAKQITDRMFRGDIEEPRTFDKHPAAIRAAAKALGALAAKTADSTCICGGSGLLDVMADNRWQGKHKLELGETFHHREHLVTVACPCPKGQWIIECRERTTPPGEPVHRLATYDAKTMELFTVWRARRDEQERAARDAAWASNRNLSGLISETAEALANPLQDDSYCNSASA